MSRAWGALAALAAYSGLGVLYMFPLAGNWSTHTIGFQADVSTWLWCLWHMRYCLLKLGVNPLWTDFQYWPWGGNLLLSHIGIAFWPFALALQTVLNLTATYNTLMLGNIVLGGFFVYLLAAAWGAGWAAAFFGGAIYAFSPFANVYLRGGGGLEFMSLPPLAAFFWALTRLSRSRRWHDAALAAAMLSWVWACNYYYFAVCSALVGFVYLWQERPVELSLERRAGSAGQRAAARVVEAALLADGLYLAYTIAVRGQRSFAGRGGFSELFAYVAPYLIFWALVAARCALSWRARARLRREAFGASVAYAGVFGFWGLLNASLVWAVLTIVKNGAYAAPASPWRGGGNPSDVIQFFIPGTYHPLFGRLGTALMGVDPPSGFLGWLPVAAVVWLWRRGIKDNAVKLWLACAVFSFVVSLGPWLKIFGVHTYLPLPFYFLHLLPLFSNMQTGYRLTVFTTLFLGLLGAAALREFQSRRRAAWIPAAALALLALDYAHPGFPLYDARVPALFDRLGERPEGTMLTIRFGAAFDVLGNAGGMSGMSLPMHFQSAHLKPLMGGGLGRISRVTRDQMYADPFLRDLLAAQDGAPPSKYLLDARRVARYMREKQLRYVVTRRDEVPDGLRRALARWPMREIDRDDQYTAYEVVSSPRL